MHTKHQPSVLEEGLASALRIVLQLAKKLGGRDGFVEEGHLSQLEELHTVESVVDILKFIETDTDSLLLRCQRVQELLLRSLTLFNGHPPSPPKQEADESLLSSEMCSPNSMSSTSENPVTSGVTAQRRQHVFLLDTFSLANQGGRNDILDAQLTLRNQEIFEEVVPDQSKTSDTQLNNIDQSAISHNYFYIEHDKVEEEEEDEEQSSMLIMSAIARRTANNLYKRVSEQSLR